MRYTKAILFSLFVVGCAHMSISSYQSGQPATSHNREAVALPGFEASWDAITRYLFEDQIDQVPAKPLPVLQVTKQQLDALPDDQISAIRFGHSTVLLKIDGKYWLTDPVFSESLGPIYTFGIPRFHMTPMAIEALPELYGVVISHNHYDHLDKKTITQLKDKAEHFFVPVGNGHYLTSWGVAADRIHELDWWESVQLDDVEVVATPANHLSGRILVDQNTALWSSWVINGKTQRVFFSGDSGYSDIFEQIGTKYGPFDLTIMENGSYDKAWAREHLTPAETVQAHIDLKGRLMLPVHNCTFDLAFHKWYEPLQEVTRLAKSDDVQVLTPRMGQPVIVPSAEPNMAEFLVALVDDWWSVEN